MNKNLLKTGVQDYISKYLETDILSVSLKKSPFPGVLPQELAEQLQGKQISKKKFPTLFKTKGILYPRKVHLEQASSEETARYKASLVSGKSVLDLTCGMGIDTCFFASRFDRVLGYEKNEELAQLTAHNLGQLGLQNVEVRTGDGMAFLDKTAAHFDCIYVDPSRRTAHTKRILPEDYEPNLGPLVDRILEKCKVLLIKTSPLLDIDAGINQFRQVIECHVVAVRNEVKELLWLLKAGPPCEPLRKAINIDTSGKQVFEFLQSQERELAHNFTEPQAFIYEPNAAILKSGGFKSVAQRYTLKKLAASSHLYTCNAPIDFPGRRFKVQEIQRFSGNWNKEWRLKNANITKRNFPMAVETIRKRFQIADGGDTYLFFTTLFDGQKVVIRCIRH